MLVSYFLFHWWFSFLKMFTKTFFFVMYFLFILYGCFINFGGLSFQIKCSFLPFFFLQFCCLFDFFMIFFSVTPFFEYL
jgi:hypothetical protein